MLVSLGFCQGKINIILYSFSINGLDNVQITAAHVFSFIFKRCKYELIPPYGQNPQGIPGNLTSVSYIAPEFLRTLEESEAIVAVSNIAMFLKPTILMC